MNEEKFSMRLLPKDKHDVSHIADLHRLTDEEIAPIIPELLEWVQDINWPVAMPVVEVLREREDLVFPLVAEIMRGDDDMWQYWINEYLVPSFTPVHQQQSSIDKHYR